MHAATKLLFSAPLAWLAWFGAVAMAAASDPVGPDDAMLSSPTGECLGIKSLAETDLTDRNHRIPVGKYLIALRHPATLAVELVGGGGGGGGTSAGNKNRTTYGTGGGAGGIYQDGALLLKPGYYAIVVGAGGKGGIGNNWRGPPVDGAPGAPTVIRLCNSPIPIAVAKGGDGGKGDGVERIHRGNDDYAGDGASLANPLTNERIGDGGAGGGWQAGGAPGSGWGSGGGGQGGNTHPENKWHGGNGADGYAIIVKFYDIGF